MLGPLMWAARSASYVHGSSTTPGSFRAAPAATTATTWSRTAARSSSRRRVAAEPSRPRLATCSGAFTITASYTYDPSTTPGFDELTSIDQGGNSTDYAYTSDGQVSGYGSTSLSWGGWGRLSAATVGSNTVTYTYDPTGALLSRASSSPASTIDYLLGDLFETDGSGAVTTSYTDGPAGDLAGYQGPPDASSTVSYEYYDAHGNLVAEADPSGTVTANHRYDPFGAPLDTQPADTTSHRFVSRCAPLPGGAVP